MSGCECCLRLFAGQVSQVLGILCCKSSQRQTGMKLAQLMYVLPCLQDELERLKAENARLQRDNERFVRLVGAAALLLGHDMYVCVPAGPGSALAHSDTWQLAGRLTMPPASVRLRTTMHTNRADRPFWCPPPPLAVVFCRWTAASGAEAASPS